MTAPHALAPRPQDAVEFLRTVKPEEPFTLVALKESAHPIAKTFDPSTPEDSIRSWISNLNEKGYNLYWHVNTLADHIRDKKALKRDIVEVRMLHVDVDDPGETALERLKAFDPRPSIILFSGGGYQAFWLLDEPMTDLARAEAINRSFAAQLGGDNCHNADRIMRLPGTINWPNAKKQKAGRVPVLAHVL